eukprot:CAMPEP_0204351744 /NCGR_PEP_ID=MMETSP0469-20131031/31350_1 /ASSEMBLY_ACC=CAM_ASM_000384 /TAXON_ID=2969 /ORGANISM="Oxyrrhis marina" /LENGTH=423 /DNA_ID=CAMNT_0051338349 /DNA_START=207 /DNA_END=1474 /DNA_ORIENTATION=-
MFLATAIVEMKNRVVGFAEAPSAGAKTLFGCSKRASPAPSEVSTRSPTSSAPTSPRSAASLEVPSPREVRVRPAPKRNPRPDPLVAFPNGGVPSAEDIEAFITDFKLDQGAATMLRTHRNVEVKAEVMLWVRGTMRNKKAVSSIRNVSSVVVKRVVMLDRQSKQKAAEAPAPPTPSASERPATTDTARLITGILNKVAPDNMGTLVEQLVELCQDSACATAAGEKLFAVATRFPQYFETYADFVVATREKLPLAGLHFFDAALASGAAQVPDCQSEAAEEKKAPYVGFLKLVAGLFVRGVVGVAQIESLVTGLMNQGAPLGAECVVELLRNSAWTLDQCPRGREVLQSTMTLLTERKASYPSRIRFLICDLEELKLNKWVFRSFGEAAQKKSDLHHQHWQETKGGTVAAPAFVKCVGGFSPKG